MSKVWTVDVELQYEVNFILVYYSRWNDKTRMQSLPHPYPFIIMLHKICRKIILINDIQTISSEENTFYY